MGIEVGGIFGLIILVADIWAIVSTFQSRAGTGKKVFWIVLVLVLPVIGFVAWLLAGPRSGKAALAKTFLTYIYFTLRLFQIHIIYALQGQRLENGGTPGPTWQPYRNRFP